MQELLHKCANCSALDSDDTWQDSYGGAVYCWCRERGCYVWQDGTCVKKED